MLARAALRRATRSTSVGTGVCARARQGLARSRHAGEVKTCVSLHDDSRLEHDANFQLLRRV